MNLVDCNISVRAYCCLKNAGITTTEELIKATNEDFMCIRNLGRRTLQEIIDFREKLK